MPHTVSEPGQPAWTGGSLCSPSSIGHTGFTGTGLWIDFDRGYGWAVLSNRVHPSRHIDTGIADLQRAVGNRHMGADTIGRARKPRFSAVADAGAAPNPELSR